SETKGSLPVLQPLGAGGVDRPFRALFRNSALVWSFCFLFFGKTALIWTEWGSVPGSCVSPMADTTPNGPQGAGAVQFMMTNKLDTAMWLSRLFTVYCSALFVLPLLGLHEAASFYQRALLANALTSALRLHQRLPHFQLSRAFLAQALLEDSCHYLLYSLIFVNSYPVTSILFMW
ncbi:Transmembrane protein 33, partial [Lemmus lemmus]